MQDASLKGVSGDKPAKSRKRATARRRELEAYKVRALIMDVLRRDSDLDAFCGDHFRHVYDRFTNGMDRVDKINCLFDYVHPTLIVKALRKSHPKKR